MQSQLGLNIRNNQGNMRKTCYVTHEKQPLKLYVSPEFSILIIHLIITEAFLLTHLQIILIILIFKVLAVESLLSWILRSNKMNITVEYCYSTP